jgi:hypothetical protein
MRISNQPSPVLIMTSQKEQDNVKYFSYLRSITTNDVKFTDEIKSRIATTKEVSTRRKLFAPTNWNL